MSRERKKTSTIYKRPAVEALFDRALFCFAPILLFPDLPSRGHTYTTKDAELHVVISDLPASHSLNDIFFKAALQLRLALMALGRDLAISIFSNTHFVTLGALKKGERTFVSSSEFLFVL